MKNHILIITLLFNLLIINNLKAQKDTVPNLNTPLSKQQPQGTVLAIDIVGKDTIPIATLQTVLILAKRLRTTDEQREFDKLKKNVIKVYPYVERAVALINELDATTAEMERRRDRKKYTRDLEKELKDTFEKELKNLTISQGKVMMKMIERRTNRTTFDMVKRFKNPVTAFFWQNMARAYGYNLKEGYSPEKYKDLESILQYIEKNGIQSYGYNTFPSTEQLNSTQTMKAADFVNQRRKDK